MCIGALLRSAMILRVKPIAQRLESIFGWGYNAMRVGGSRAKVGVE